MTTPSESERLKNELNRLKTRKKDFVESPQQQITTRLGELDESIASVDPRPVTQQGNRSMYEHLVKLKEGIEHDPNAWVNYRIEQLNMKIRNVESELESL
ncbi:hypothetical protein OSG_eHP15_00120 [environmental Halophage eHP-15]|nr:hypothetical protein OSG_eHP15_00120 [environmental Halophage eHP-15]